MNTAIGLFLKFSGLKFTWDKLDGVKGYLGAGIILLGGVSGLLQEVLALANGKDFSAVIQFAQHLPTDLNIQAIGAGLLGLGLRHNQDKVAQIPYTTIIP